MKKSKRVKIVPVSWREGKRPMKKRMREATRPDCEGHERGRGLAQTTTIAEREKIEAYRSTTH